MLHSVIDRGNGVSTTIAVKDGNLITGTSQDCTPIMEDAQARHNAGFTGTSEMKHAARIPDVIVEKYCNDNGILFSEFLSNKVHIKRVLNDPALAYFRIWKGKV
jgi:hypothetical protein